MISLDRPFILERPLIKGILLKPTSRSLKGDPIERVYIPKFVGLGRVSGFKSEGCTLRC